jgi:hypothetical protein
VVRNSTLSPPAGVPSPSWPSALSPQHQAAPDMVTAQASCQPTVTEAQVVDVPTWTGWLAYPPELPLPSSPS